MACSNQLVCHCMLQLQGTGAKSRSLANLYKRFSSDEVHKKPLVLAETAAMWLPDIEDGASELDIKSAWWQQVRGLPAEPSQCSLHLQLMIG